MARGLNTVSSLEGGKFWGKVYDTKGKEMGEGFVAKQGTSVVVRNMSDTYVVMFDPLGCTDFA